MISLVYIILVYVRVARLIARQFQLGVGLVIIQMRMRMRDAVAGLVARHESGVYGWREDMRVHDASGLPGLPGRGREARHAGRP